MSNYLVYYGFLALAATGIGSIAGLISTNAFGIVMHGNVLFSMILSYAVAASVSLYGFVIFETYKGDNDDM